jgi:glutamate-1-semialdehyde 2,1-aminomutase
MQAFDPKHDGTPAFIAQTGTLNGNPIAAVAGLATLRVLREPGAYARLHARGRALKDGLAAALREAGVPGQVVGEAPLFDVVFTERPVTDYRALLTADSARMKAFNAGCLSRGVLKGGQKIYVSLAHSEDDVAHTLEAFRGSLSALPATSRR